MMNDARAVTSPYIEVSLPLPLFNNFTYSIPDELSGKASIGARVLVPFGRRILTGYVVNDCEHTEIEQVKPILDVVDDVPLLTPPLYELAQWMSKYYVCPLGMVIKAILPAGLVRESKVRVALTEGSDMGGTSLKSLTSGQRSVLGLLVSRSPRTLSALRRALARERVKGSVWSIVSGLEKKGLITTEQVLGKDVSGARTTKIITLTDKRPTPGKERELLLGRSRRQRECYEWMESVRSPVEMEHLVERVGFPPRVIRSLFDKGLLLIQEREEEFNVPPMKQDGFGRGWSQITPTTEQKNARDEILDPPGSGSEVFLLHGVTSSGKTVVYIEVLKKILEKGLSAIVLVPEISLTPQTISRFREVFPGMVTTVHSRLSARERYQIWMASNEGKVRILVGPRSAVFSPMKNLGLIIVDEEHEPSYKQEETPRYHARDVAIRRGKIEGATVVLGSATPSLESYYQAIEGKYRIIRLPDRFGQGTFPSIRIVDMKEESGVPVLSESLKKEVGKRVAKEEQVILFLNRRGYSSFLQCGSCGWVGQCVSCDISLTLHRRPLYLVCHYCDHREDIPDECPRCKGRNLLFRGVGTERVDREVKNLFPDTSVERMDLDTTSGKWSHRDILEKFLDGETQILLGTQMIAKGLDFPNVTLVGVVNADIGLNMPDFRAEERTFQILMQVSGRTGRGEKGGEVLIQTYLPDVTVIEAVKNHEFDTFAVEELVARENAVYPPYVALANVIVLGKDAGEVSSVAAEVTRELEILSNTLCEGALTVVGPAPCAHTRLRGMYRWHVLIKSHDQENMGRILAAFVQKWHKGKGNVKVMVDRDPMTLM